MVLTLYFLRHGQTSFSRANAYCGELDPPLTNAGLAMAEAFAAHYAQLPWQAVFVSPMLRTRTTAQLEIKREYPDGNILIVSIRMMLCGLLGIDVGRFRDRIAAPVASVSIVEYTSPRRLLLALAERSHLSPELRQLPGT
ncbi:MAG: histidine phosphatase family protein [Thermosynechococcus sp.]